MARTPLLRMLQRLASDHAEADRRSLPVDTIRAERSSGVTRRDLLKGMGGVAAAAAVSRAGVARAKAHAPRIAIVGGGIAGMNAALTLQDAGYASTVYEAAPHVGGRMRSNTTTYANGQVTEWCGELIDSGHTTIQALAQRFNLTLDALHPAEPAGSTETYYFLGHYYSFADADRDFKPVYDVLQKQSTDAPFPTLYNASTAEGRRLDRMSVRDWIGHYVPGGHKSKLGLLLDVAYAIEYGRDTIEQSSLNLVYLLGSVPSQTLNLFGASDEAFHIRGGNQQLPRAIEGALPAGHVKTQWRLTTLAKNSDGTASLTFDTPLGTRAVVADRVILAIPFSVLRHVDTCRAGFDGLKNLAITQLGYGTNAKLQLQFSDRHWQEHGPWGIGNGTSYADTGYQATWDVTRAQPGKTGILVGYSGGSVGAAYEPDGPYTTSASAKVRGYAADFLAQLEPVFPGITSRYAGTATLSTPARDPNLRGSYSCWLVGQYTLFSGYEGARQGKIHFAGEHCSTNFQGFMEGGAEEGERAAQEILADYAAGAMP